MPSRKSLQAARQRKKELDTSSTQPQTLSESNSLLPDHLNTFDNRVMTTRFAFTVQNTVERGRDKAAQSVQNSESYEEIGREDQNLPKRVIFLFAPSVLQTAVTNTIHERRGQLWGTRSSRWQVGDENGDAGEAGATSRKRQRADEDVKPVKKVRVAAKHSEGESITVTFVVILCTTVFIRSHGRTNHLGR
ncbi:hypothetical protein DFH09DRAFT_1294557 [Mycena vulgaris]|nr:hypothetical protein DFH09DRAFT_1294557 [Mycena vulgaris]